MIDTITKGDVSMRIAQQRLYHRDPKTGKPKPLCLACGAEATNTLPSCNNPKCVKSARATHRWATKIVDYVTGAAA